VGLRLGHGANERLELPIEIGDCGIQRMSPVAEFSRYSVTPGQLIFGGFESHVPSSSATRSGQLIGRAL
jgi:hypothetical protein